MPYLAAAAAVVSMIGTGVAVYGQQQQAKAVDSTAKYNAKLMRQQAEQETQVTVENARRKTRENARIIGMQRAALAQSGLAMEGTPLAILGETATTLQRDILDMGYDAASRARALQEGARRSLIEGGQQSSALRFSSLATGISGVTGAAAGYGQAKGLFAPSN